MSLQKKNLTLKKVSRCLYCSSPSYGKGCKFGPKGAHFHPDDPKKCSYCGSSSYGKGCQLNPFGKIHLHGIDYNSMFNEQIQEAVQNQFLLSLLNKKFEDFEAYRLGIINESGDKIKEPVTEQERISYSPYIKTVLKIKKYLGPKLDLINQVAVLESSNAVPYNREKHLNLLQFEERINEIINQLHKITHEALQEGITAEQIEKIIQK